MTIYMNLAKQETSFPLSICEYMDDIRGLESSGSVFLSLWRCLKTSKYLGFGYFNTTGYSPTAKYGDGTGTSEQAIEINDFYENLFRSVTEKGLLTRQVVHAEHTAGSYIICPVYGPYHQNAIFILHSPQAVADHDENELRKIDMILQRTHVLIAEYESNLREKKLALSGREEEVLILMSDGMSNRSIADRLNISVHTINGYVRCIMLKLNTTDRLSACMIGLSIPKIANKARRVSSDTSQHRCAEYAATI